VNADDTPWINRVEDKQLIMLQRNKGRKLLIPWSFVVVVVVVVVVLKYQAVKG
jgi:hypothetical protein